ncbi:hypothetical protein [Nonomuraea zeae]|uniref:Uncharacterized protein n=1 Tax=Nonomuraea zeae TaxID=1642303 RepID=A0A5S4FYY2_9ACTN|nr:hypothetical protein [Nonomuraea zeae]TMR16738.1 hypothetical protein ETD85_54865 [Nonomuraea zeae]
MYKRIAKISAGAALALLTALGLAVGTAGPASATMDPAVCDMFIRIMIGYDERGDRATADAMWTNLYDQGCVP